MDEDGTGVTSADSPRALSFGSSETERTAATTTAAPYGTSQGTTHATVSTPKEAMRYEELRRMRAGGAGDDLAVRIAELAAQAVRVASPG